MVTTAKLLVLVNLAASACVVDSTVDPLGRPCTTEKTCGPGSTCDPETGRCHVGRDVGVTNWEKTADSNCSDSCAAGQACIDGTCRCTRQACDGCCDDQQCVPLGSQTASRCGQQAAACRACDNELTCYEANRCELGECRSGTLKTNRCLIDNTCHEEGEVDPSNGCRQCLPAKSQATWSDVLASGCVQTLAGSGTAGFVNGPADQAQFSAPSGIAVDSNGVVFVADTANHCIRKIEGGTVSTFAGDGTAGHFDSSRLASRFVAPTGLALSGPKLYVADEGDHRIRMIDNTVVTVAGSGVAGLSNDRLRGPTDIAVADDTRVFIADPGNNLIRDYKNAIIYVHAGGGAGYADGQRTDALFRAPQGIVLDGDGKLLVADTGNHRIRMIATDDQVTTLVGGAEGFTDGIGAAARLNSPTAIVPAGNSTYYVADRGNHAIRKLTPSGLSTLAGNGSADFVDGPLAEARFSAPTAVAVDGQGVVYVADRDNHRIRIIAP